MNGPRDDLLDALHYQVKEEVINNYLRERLILEEEIKDYTERLEKYRVIEAEVREIRDQLACLLVTPQNFQHFFSLLGFTSPPLRRLGRADIEGRAPSCPLGLTPRGFTNRGRYLNLTQATYDILRRKVKEGQEATEELLSLALEINKDIKTFHMNFDLMAIINFLKSLDVDMLVKKKFLGDNFSPAEMSSLEQRLSFKALNPEADGIRIWPELPPPDEVRKLTADFTADVFHREKETVLPALY
ncbi:MAG: hypothetical protein SV487_13410 [Thermodesulfobacteriota bacterium]|nr:hypothetical protein [Thermodesulfobacteriota bacterium]